MPSASGNCSSNCASRLARTQAKHQRIVATATSGKANQPGEPTMFNAKAAIPRPTSNEASSTAHQ